MQFSRPMIELVFEIRRRVDSEMKPGVKLANPQMMQELAELYQRGADVIIKALIKELFTLAGEDWQDILEHPEIQVQKQSMKMYRGQAALTDQPAPEELVEEVRQPTKPVRIYRGQIIE